MAGQGAVYIRLLFPLSDDDDDREDDVLNQVFDIQCIYHANKCIGSLKQYVSKISSILTKRLAVKFEPRMLISSPQPYQIGIYI